MLSSYMCQGYGIILGTFIYTDTGYHVYLDGKDTSVIYDIFPSLLFVESELLK